MSGERASGDEVGRRRTRLTLERLVTAAYEVARELGADRFTMKDVAGRLQVGTMSLYYYVPDKAALLDEVVSLLYGAVELPPREAPWRERVESIARQIYTGFAEVPGLDPFAPPRLPPHEHRTRVANAMLTALHDAGLPPSEASVAAMVVLGFAVGRGTASTRRPRTASGVPEPAAEHPPGLGIPGVGSDVAFDLGIQLLLDGLAQRATPPAS